MLSDDKQAEDQLVSFFLYSFIIYPIAGYLISPQRPYSKAYGAIFVVCFLFSVALAHYYYQNQDKGPNFYQLLGVGRETTSAVLKKAYRTISLELHPDKNKSPTAEAEFTRLKMAFDVLNNREARNFYDLFGESFAALSFKTTIDLNYILVSLLIQYGSSIMVTFFMTFSEPTGDAMFLSLFGLAVLLFIESLFIFFNLKIPSNILPQTTPRDIIVLLHRLYPAYMNCVRCVLGAYYIDPRKRRSDFLEQLVAATQSNEATFKDLSQSLISSNLFHESKVDRSLNLRENTTRQGIVAMALAANEVPEADSKRIKTGTNENKKQSWSIFDAIINPGPRHAILRDLFVYLLIVYAFCGFFS